MILHFKCVLVVTRTTTISIYCSTSQKIKSGDLEFLPLFLSFFRPSFVLVCLVFFLELRISSFSYFFPISSLVFYHLNSFSATFTLRFSLRNFRVPSLCPPSHHYSVRLYHTILSLSFSAPLYIILFFLTPVKLKFSLNTFH